MTCEGLGVIMGIKRRSLTGGEVFGRLTVVEYTHSTKRRDGSAGERVMKCKCECGNETEARTSNLYSGNTTSCGCIQSERTAKANSVRAENEIPECNNPQAVPSERSEESASTDFLAGPMKIQVRLENCRSQAPNAVLSGAA